VLLFEQDVLSGQLMFFLIAVVASSNIGKAGVLTAHGVLIPFLLHEELPHFSPCGQQCILSGQHMACEKGQHP